MTPLSRPDSQGRFTAALSIRRGKGSQTHDRIYRFHPQFACADSARRYAAEQGRNWLANPLTLA